VREMPPNLPLIHAALPLSQALHNFQPDCVTE